MTDQTVQPTEQPDQLVEILAERAQVVADLHAFADFLGRNSWAPLPYMRLQASVQTNPDDVWHGGEEGVAELRRIADALGKEPRERLDDRTEVTSHFGSVEYHVVTWHRGGRPGEVERLRAEVEALRAAAAQSVWCGGDCTLVADHAGDHDIRQPLVSDETIVEAGRLAGSWNEREQRWTTAEAGQ